MKKKCEDCMGTGWVGDNGPGIKGNNEYHKCDCGNPPRYPDPIEQARKEGWNKAIAKAVESIEHYWMDVCGEDVREYDCVGRRVINELEKLKKEMK